MIELGANNRPKEAVREFASMARMGAQPDTMAGTALVHACARNGKMDMAQVRQGRSYLPTLHGFLHTRYCMELRNVQHR